MTGSIAKNIRQVSLIVIMTLTCFYSYAQTPTITIQPTNDTSCAGNSASFTITATGATSYQWQENAGSGWSNISNGGIYSGATTNNISLSSVTSVMHNYQYRCVATNSGSVTSNAVSLLVAGITNTTNDTVCSGGNGTLTASATGISSIINWYTASSGGTLVDTGNTLTINSATTTTTYYAEAAGPGGAGIPDSLPTPYNTNNGQRGAMFDVVTGSAPITVTKFDCSIYSGTTADYEIYYRAGTHVGFENNSGAWTYLGGATNVTSLGNNVPTPLPITFSVTIPANTRYSFYITNTSGGGTSYTDGTAVGNYLAGNSDATIYEGTGKSYPFGLSFTVRNINATMYYTKGGSCSSVRVGATLTVNPNANITSNPANSSITALNNTPFSISATGATSYQWQVSTNSGSTWSNLSNGFVYSNVTTTTLGLSSVPSVYNGYLYRCIASNTSGCNDTSAAATLSVSGTAPSITVQPSNSTICPGNTSFSITATGTSLTYQWQVSSNSGSTWSNLSNTGIYTGTTTNTLSLTAATSAQNSYQYRCVVTGSVSPAATSNVATLTISTAPAITAHPGNSTICENTNTTFSAVATGAGLTYQWQVSTNNGSTWGNLSNTGIYSNVTTSTLSLTNATTAVHNNLYRCVISGNCSPNATSNAATLTINNTPSVTAQPGSTVICNGGNTSFSITATGTGITYQWQESTNGGSTWSNLSNTGIYSNVTTNTLTLTGATSSANNNQYRCVVNGSCTPTATSNSATLTINTAPGISSHPANTATCDGSNATFVVSATGTGLSYQWQVSSNSGSTWSNLTNTGIYSGVTTNTLSLTSASTSVNTYQYRCIINGSCTPSVTSNAATLSINSSLSITMHPSNSIICENSNTSFSVIASASGLTYQWQVSTNGGSTWNNLSNSGIYSGVTTSSLSLTNVTTSMNSYQYRCVLSSTCTAPSNSNAAALTVNIEPTITTQPINSTICENTNTAFSITANGTGLTYQWQVNNGSSWSNVTNTGIYSGANTNNLTLTSVTTTVDGYQYRCIVGGTCVPGVNSNAVILSVNTAPAITSQAVNSTICEGNNTSFSVTATGTLLNYQWQISTNGGSTWSNVANSGIYTGATTATLALTSATTAFNNYQYRCLISGACTPNVTSNAAILTVNTSPAITTQPANSTICETTNTTFSVTAAGTGLTYQWEVYNGSTWSNVNNTGIYSGATTNTLSLTNATTAVDGYQYRCSIGGTCIPGVNTNAATLNIQTPPVITTQPLNSTICETSNTMFTVAATGAGLTYQWEVYDGNTWSNVNNTGIYSGATTNTLSLTNTTTAVDGYQYRCSITGTCTPATTSNAVTLTISNAPTVTTQPVNSAICNGNSTSFSINATGTNTSYQWEVYDGNTWSNVNNTGIYNGATTNTLNLTNATTAVHSYQYRCIVSGTCTPDAMSNVVTLTINTAPSITTQLSNSTICEHTNTSFSVNANGTGLTYQWQANDGSGWNNISNTGIYNGTTTNTLSLTNATTAVHSYQYRCVVSGTCTPSATSNSAQLSIQTAPVITSNPNNDTTCDGGNALFSINATGAGLNYQWQVSTNTGVSWSKVSNTGIYSGATSQTLTLTASTATIDGYQYRCVVSGSCSPAATTSAASITIFTLPAVTSHPTPAVVCEGSNTSYNISATGTDITYQWQYSYGSGWTNISNNSTFGGANSNTLNITSTPSWTNGASFRCVVSGTCTPPAISNAASLTVNKIPAIAYHPANDTVCENQSAGFSTGATGTGLTYQWQVSTNAGTSWNNVNNGGVYSGATTSFLQLSNLTVSYNDYRYRCLVNGTCTPSLTSNAARLTILSNAIITGQPTSNMTICSGDTTSLSINATGSSLKYQWYIHNGSNYVPMTNNSVYSGVNSATLQISGISVSNTAKTFSYFCTVSGPCVGATSSAAYLTVNALPDIKSDPADITVCDSTPNVSFSVSATGTGLVYQWQMNSGSSWNNLANNSTYSGTNSSTLLLNQALYAMNGYQYRCIITGTCSPNTVSSTATLTVNPLKQPSVTISPSKNDICENETVTFTANQTNGGNADYQWELNGNIVGNNSNTYSNNNLNNMDVVICIMTSNIMCPSPKVVLSNAVTMKVTKNVTPTITISSDVGNSWCTGKENVFRSNFTNEGNNPTFNWTINGASSGNNIDTLWVPFLNDGDIVECEMISDHKCPVPKSVNSNKIEMEIFQTTLASILIMADPDTIICDQTEVTFRTAFHNGGANPQWQWMLNGTDIQGETQGSLKTSTLKDGDTINCRFISSARCVFPEISNPLTFDVNPLLQPEVDITVVYIGGGEHRFTALPQNGGINPTYIWYRNGKKVQGQSNESIILSGLQKWEKIWVEMASNEECLQPNMRLVSSRLITTGVEEQSNNYTTLRLYPNPNTGKFTIEGDLNFDGYKSVNIEILNSLGQAVYDQDIKVSNGDLNQGININNNLAAGTYMIKLKYDDKYSYRKFVLIK